MMHSISSGNLNLLVGRDSNPEKPVEKATEKSDKTEKPEKPEKSIGSESPSTNNNAHQPANKNASKEEEDRPKNTEIKISSPKIVSRPSTSRPASTTESLLHTPVSTPPPTRPPIPNKPLPQAPSRENRSASAAPQNPLHVPLRHKSRSFSDTNKPHLPAVEEEQKSEPKRRTPLAAFCSTCGTRLNTAGVCSQCD